MDVRLYNTATRQKEIFKPLQRGAAGVYACGPTVYARAHLGNMRANLFADTLVRVLRFAGYDVRHVMNITDVGHLVSDGDEGDDKLEVGAKREGTTAWEIARKYEQLFFEDCALLNITKPNIVCRATEHIEEQIAMVAALESRGYAYVTQDGVYFDTQKYTAYGEFAKLDMDGLRGGERVELGGKRSKTDFALWKFSPADKTRDMEWESPWGKGFPGWHIECSAMSTKYLGETFDIHTGGTDHIPVHHTNEIAQSRCAHPEAAFAKLWMHCQFLIMGKDEKMSKSSGHDYSVTGISDKGIDPLAYRYMCLTAHYRNYLNYSEEALQTAATALHRLRLLCNDIGYTEEHANNDLAAGRKNTLLATYPAIAEALLDDLNTAKAIVALRDILKDSSITTEDKRDLLTVMDGVLGLVLSLSADQQNDDLPDDIAALVKSRDDARAAKDWATSDAVRDQLQAAGWSVEDTSDGTKVKKA